MNAQNKHKDLPGQNVGPELTRVLRLSCKRCPAAPKGTMAGSSPSPKRILGTGDLLRAMLETGLRACGALRRLGVERAGLLSCLSQNAMTETAGPASTPLPPLESETATPAPADAADSAPHTMQGENSADAIADNQVSLSAEASRTLRIAMLEARKYASAEVDASHLLLAFTRVPECQAGNALRQLGISYDKLCEQLQLQRQEPTDGFGFDRDELEQGEAALPAGGASPFVPEAEKEGARDGGTPVVDKYATDLTRLAEQGALDPVVGREQETLRVAQILSRRKKNNPVLIGEPGVGKSAVVEGLATLIVSRRAPRNLLGRRIVALEMASMVAGTQFRGQFEQRVKSLIEELRQHREIILFIDEIHTIIGAGSAAGTLDAANILKPALARGEVQCIGSTTLEEYRRSIEKDGALERRFQRVLVDPTSLEDTLTILANLQPRYEKHHGVHYTEQALHACVDLTARYVASRAFPDKAIDALDEAGARVRLRGMTLPPEIEQQQESINALKAEKNAAAKAQDYERAARLRDELVELEHDLTRRTHEWQQTAGEGGEVTDQDVAEVVSMMSGVPASKVSESETERLRGMREALRSKVIDQDEAIDKVVRAIARGRIGLKDSNRPIGTFMFVGPTGVGKTYLVQQLAEWMFGRKDALIRIDMSEYGEKHTASRMVGAPPGYVGYEEGGQLTERVRRKPYSVVLLDEIEKAHPDVFNTLLQVMDEGRLTDGSGTTVDFRNTIIIMTSNSGSRQISDFGTALGFEADPTGESQTRRAEDIVMKTLRRQFAPEFLGRLDDVVMFHALTRQSAGRIFDLELAKLQQRVQRQGYTLSVSSEAKERIITDGFDARRGARSLRHAMQTHIEDAACDFLLSVTSNPSGKTPAELHVVVREGEIKIETTETI